MHFSISRKKENGLDLYILKDDQLSTEIGILPAFGAILHSFSLHTPDGPFNFIDNYKDIDDLEKTLSSSYKSSKLSPFPCRIKDGRYTYDGVNYEFQKKFPDGSAIHGLLFDKSFDILSEDVTAGSAALTMRYQYKNDDPGYPYQYTCLVKYVLHPENLLEVETTIVNDSETAIPIADGWHPYFNLGGEVDDWLMHFEAASIVEFDEHLVPTGRTLPYELFNEPRRIGQHFLDNCFLIKKTPDKIACEIYNPEKKLRISFIPDDGYPYLQIYTPPHRKSIAIENLSAAPDSFNNKMGLTILQPRHSQRFTVYYKANIV